MNNADHLISGITVNPAAPRDRPAGYDDRYADLLKWAHLLYENLEHPLCILEPGTLRSVYANSALVSIFDKSQPFEHALFSDFVSRDTFKEVSDLMDFVENESFYYSHASLSIENAYSYELKITRHKSQADFLTVEFFQSVTERRTDSNTPKSIEGNVPGSSDELNRVVSSLDDVVFEYDSDGNFKKLWCNNDVLLQRMPRDYVGKSLRDAYHFNPELTGNFIHDFEKALTNNEICYRDFQLTGHEETRWFSSKITPIYSPDGKPKGFSQRITDISEQKKVDLAIHEKNLELRSAHRELKEIIENTSEIIFKLDGDNRIIFVSPEFERTLGLPGKEIVGQSIADIIHPEDRIRFQSELGNARLSRKPEASQIYRVSVPGADDRWFNITAKYLRNKRDESFTGIVFAKDITELKQTLDSLAASEERYRSVVNSLTEGIVMHDSKGLVVACNYAAEQMFQLERGKGPGDVLRQPDLRVVKEDGSAFLLHEFPAMITLTTGKRVKDVTMGVYKSDGEITWLTLNTEPLYYKGESGPPDGVVASMIDIIEQKVAREKLVETTRQIREYSERITGILDSITDGFIAVDNNLEVTLWNKVIETITGISQSYAVGRNITTLNTYLADQIAFHNYKHAILHKSVVSFEQYIPALDLWFESNAYPFSDGLFIYLRDITYRKNQENLLALEKRVLEQNAHQLTTLKETVEHFLEGLEQIFPGMLCSVLTLDDDGVSMRHMSAPKLPKEFIDKINGLHIGPAVGSCGTAMFTKSNVIVSDISTDPLWADHRDLASAHDLNACWSFPILTAQNEVLATIAAYYRHAASPTPMQLQILDRVQNLLRVIIENKKADSRIRISNERYLLATRATNDAIWDYNISSDSVYHGEGYANIFGHRTVRSPRPLSEWTSRIHEDDRDRVRQSFDNFILSKTHKHWEAEYRFIRADGQYAMVCDRGYLIFNQEGQVARVIGSMQDITDRKQLEKQILKQELDRQKLVAQAVVDAQEKERAEIGKELHDNVNQILSTAKLYLELARSDEKERLNLIARSTENIFDAINEIRAISRSLVPPSIGDLGIIESIKDLMENVRATKRLKAEFYYTAGIDFLINEKQQLMLFRIIQEQVNNVLKHAEATNLIIELMVDGSIVDLTISDNGKGFDKENNKSKRGVGLANISSRTELFNGEVNLITAPGKGCTLNIHIPIINE
ncbi:PAS domain S-box protein [Flavitalea antarctica]